MNVWGWVGLALYVVIGVGMSIELGARAAAYRSPAEEDSLEARVQVSMFALFWPVTVVVLAYVWTYNHRREQLTRKPPLPTTHENADENKEN